MRRAANAANARPFHWSTNAATVGPYHTQCSGPVLVLRPYRVGNPIHLRLGPLYVLWRSGDQVAGSSLWLAFLPDSVRPCGGSVAVERHSPVDFELRADALADVGLVACFLGASHDSPWAPHPFGVAFYRYSIHPRLS